ncbi:VanZ family protein [Chryseobacterium sp. FH1]|uniref:VanZ family protein n=1 Tax=Chryseobacterium sp. FH1 TaxID=1233951 RepID=UPI0004E46807|nr:VanZ family protein [Chryseobacterium sp. FH1]KFC19512.1 hypothetical protein IO90_09480 [Chryseobacterium sp. FH1]
MTKNLPFIYLVLAACVAMAVSFYRTVLFQIYGFDSVIVGCLPNFTAVLLISLIFNLAKKSKKDSNPLKVSVMGTGTMVFYELIQTFIQGRTFDWFDIFASLIGGVFVYTILLMARQKN